MADESDFEELPPDFEEVSSRKVNPGNREHSDDELGLRSGPVATGITKAGPVTLAIPKLFDALSPEEKKNLDAEFIKFLTGKGELPSPNSNRFMDNPANREIVGQVVGSAIVPVGEGIGAPIGRKILQKAPEMAAKTLPKTLEAVTKAIEHSKAEAGKLHIASALGQDLAAAGGATARAAGRTVAGGVPMATGAVAGNVQPSTPEAKPFKGVMSNAVERLRVAAQTDQRARDLLGRIEGTQGAGTNEVTQSTQGEAH